MAMKLGIISDNSVEGVKWVAEKGLHYVEYCYNVGRDVAELEQAVPALQEAYAKYDVKLGSLGRWGSDKIDEKGCLIEQEWENTCRLIDVAAALDCPVFNTGVNYAEQLPYLANVEAAKNFLAKAVEYGAQKGVKIATYNCDWNNFVRTPDEWKLIHNAVPGLGLKYDPSHCINTGSGKYLEEIRDWGDKIHHFHIKGTINLGGVHVDDPPAGLDCIQWRTVMGLLYACDYNGMLSIEPHSGVWKGKLGEWGIDYTIKYISEMIFNEEDASDEICGADVFRP